MYDTIPARLWTSYCLRLRHIAYVPTLLKHPRFEFKFEFETSHPTPHPRGIQAVRITDPDSQPAVHTEGAHTRPHTESSTSLWNYDVYQVHIPKPLTSGTFTALLSKSTTQIWFHLGRQNFCPTNSSTYNINFECNTYPEALSQKILWFNAD